MLNGHFFVEEYIPMYGDLYGVAVFVINTKNRFPYNVVTQSPDSNQLRPQPSFVVDIRPPPLSSHVSSCARGLFNLLGVSRQ